MRNIIIVEDDEDIADSIRYNLEREGFRVRIAATGEDALNVILNGPPSLILLDLNLPRMSGFEICRRLRAESSTALVPIIMLTARADEADKVLGLNMGADDYIAVPFNPEELVARLHALRRRTFQFRPESLFSFGDVMVDFMKMEVVRGHVQISLALKEFRTLEFMIKNARRAISRDELLNAGSYIIPSKRTFQHCDEN